MANNPNTDVFPEFNFEIILPPISTGCLLYMYPASVSCPTAQNNQTVPYAYLNHGTMTTPFTIQTLSGYLRLLLYIQILSKFTISSTHLYQSLDSPG
jgi:hypothetical protein